MIDKFRLRDDRTHLMPDDAAHKWYFTEAVARVARKVDNG